MNTKKSVIRLMNHCGDQAIAEFDPQTEEGCKVAQDKLTEFLEDCIAKHGSMPAVWKRRLDAQPDEFSFFKVERCEKRVNLVDPVNDAAEILLGYPLRGG